jgi:hypothetical protein
MTTGHVLLRLILDGQVDRLFLDIIPNPSNKDVEYYQFQLNF